LQVTSFDHNVREIQQVNFQWVEHAFSGHNNLPWPFFLGKGSYQSCNLLCGLPLGELTETFLACPHACVDNFEEKLSCSRIEDETRAVNGFGR
jgi:hypothetical protein